jgi:hypothetical protein
VRIPGNNLALLLFAALIALFVAGCGGGDGETETSTPTLEETTALTHDELIAQGDGICAEVNAAVGALTASEAEESGSSDQSEKVANLYLGMIERLQGLGAPAEEDSSYVKFMEAAEELAKVEGELKLAAEREDVLAMEEAGQEASAALEEFQSQAAIYGFEDCSEEPGVVTPAGSGETAPSGEELEGGEEGGVEPEYVEPAPEEEIVPEEEPAPETGGAGGVEEAPAPEPSGESGGVGPG